MTEDLFADLDDPHADQVLDISSDEDEGEPLALMRKHGSIHTRSANSAEKLGQVLPTVIERDESWHVLTRGDVDMFSFIEHLFRGVDHVEFLMISTWRINAEALVTIREWLDSGRLERFDLVIDVRFMRLGPDEYRMARDLAFDFGGRVVLSKNHSKLTLIRSGQTKLVLESSANVNCNRRLEHTAVHHSHELYHFYEDFFSKLGRPL